MANNASFNCNAGKMLVLPRGWDQKEMFLSMIEKALSAAAPRKAYYPGAPDRWERLTRGREGVIKIGASGPEDGKLPWTMIRDLDPARDDEPLFATEPFAASSPSSRSAATIRWRSSPRPRASATTGSGARSAAPW